MDRIHTDSHEFLSKVTWARQQCALVFVFVCQERCFFWGVTFMVNFQVMPMDFVPGVALQEKASFLPNVRSWVFFFVLLNVYV